MLCKTSLESASSDSNVDGHVIITELLYSVFKYTVPKSIQTNAVSASQASFQISKLSISYSLATESALK
jgi:hypothetical protein